MLRTTEELNGALVFPIAEMQYEFRMMNLVRLNVHVVNTFVLVACLKHTRLVHAKCGSSGPRNARMNQRLLIGLQSIQSLAQNVTSQLKRMEDAT